MSPSGPIRRHAAFRHQRCRHHGAAAEGVEYGALIKAPAAARTGEHWPKPQAQGMLRAVVIQLERQSSLLMAQALLDGALAQLNTLHLPGARALHRERLGRVLELTAADRVQGLDDLGLT